MAFAVALYPSLCLSVHHKLEFYQN